MGFLTWLIFTLKGKTQKISSTESFFYQTNPMKDNCQLWININQWEIYLQPQKTHYTVLVSVYYQNDDFNDTTTASNDAINDNHSIYSEVEVHNKITYPCTQTLPITQVENIERHTQVLMWMTWLKLYVKYT